MAGFVGRLGLNAVRGSAARVAARQFSQSHVVKSEVSKFTGQTGLAVGGVGLGAFLMSKEIIVIHSETVVVVALGIMTKVLYDKAGPGIAEFLDGRSDGVLGSMSEGAVAKKNGVEEALAIAKATPESLSGVADLFDIARELDAINRELAFRDVQHDTRNAAVKELEDFIKIESDVKAAEQSEMIAALQFEILNGLKGQEGAILKQCVADLAALSAAK
eukprot:m.256110 g.256110  ORF g.256110 m.256110 type:complete len:218 (-) comp34068_c0_seq1:263-916(-)